MHRHEQNTEATVTLTVSQWRTVHAALQMTALTIESAIDSGDTGLSDPRSFRDLSPLIWNQGISRASA